MPVKVAGSRPWPGTPGGTCLPGEESFVSSGGWVAQTRHAWRFSTRSFALDFSYSRQESQAAPASAALARPVAAAAPAPRKPARPLPGFAEVLRRSQLAQLIMMPSLPPADRVALSQTDQSLPALPGQVCRAYAQAQGPLAAPASCCFMA